jgi:diguanylate cyclase (GGDEF)-like protein
LEQDLGRVTLSLGVASWPDQALSPEELLKAADKALYRAKQKGRNRVEVAGT